MEGPSWFFLNIVAALGLRGRGLVEVLKDYVVVRLYYDEFYNTVELLLFLSDARHYLVLVF